MNAAGLEQEIKIGWSKNALENHRVHKERSSEWAAWLQANGRMTGRLQASWFNEITSEVKFLSEVTASPDYADEAFIMLYHALIESSCPGPDWVSMISTEKGRYFIQIPPQ